MTVRQRGNAWQVIVDGGRDPVSGRRRQVTGTAANEREAKRLEAKLRSEVDRGKHAGANMTLGALFDRYMDEAGPAGRNTRANRRQSFNNHVRNFVPPKAPKGTAALGDVSIRKLTTSHLNVLYRSMEDRGYAANTVRNVHVCISAALKFAMDSELVAVNVAAKARKPSVPPSPVRPTPTDRVVAFLSALEAEGEPSRQLLLLVYLAATLGCRRGELVALRWSDFDFVNSRVIIDERVVVDYDHHGVLVVPATKNGRVRAVSVPPGVMGRVRARHVEVQAMAALCGGDLSPDAFLFSADVSGATPWRPDATSARMHRASERLGLGKVKLHELRHHAVTTMLSNHVDVTTASERSGHRPDVMLGIYSHFMPAPDRDAATILERALEPHPKD